MSDFAPLRPECDFIASCSPGGSTPGSVPAHPDIEASQYLEMEAAFRPQGGMADSDEVAERLLRHTDQPISRLARWIVNRDVLSVSWRSRLMLPLFQFDLAAFTPRPPVREVIRELTPVLGDWALALWFARSNALLGGATPADAIARDPAAVLEAAREERQRVRTVPGAGASR
jgi:hypothetical protein